MQRGLDVLASLCGVAAYGVLGWAAWIAFDRAWLSGSLYIGELELAACLLDLVRRLTGGEETE